MAYLLVMAVIVVLIKNKAQREYYMSTLVSLKVAFFLSFFLSFFHVLKIKDGEQN